MSDSSQSDCDNHVHEQSNPRIQPLSSAYLNIENGAEPHSRRPPPNKVLSEHDAYEECFEPSSTYEETVSDEEFVAAQDAKIANFFLARTAAPTTTIVISPRASLLSRLFKRFRSIKAAVKAEKNSTQPGLSYNSHNVPTHKYPVPVMHSISALQSSETYCSEQGGHLRVMSYEDRISFRHWQ